MKINLISSCPEYFGSNLTTSILGRAQKKGLVTIEIVNLRDFADGQRKKIVDDTPYGGGPGMILKIEPIARALDYLTAKNERGQALLTSAKGAIFCQKTAQRWSQLPALTLICGHFEGVDERVLNLIDGEISLGQFILTGGEPAACVMIDATVRLLPGVLGNQDSLSEESFASGTLEYPQYTRPAEFRGLRVPEILLSGHHGRINAWRQAQSQVININKNA